jgi:V/A-type H+-transporting ATPase subunit D
MPKVKLTKNELKRQKEALKRFLRYLPMLLLKKQQLQLEISKVYNAIEKIKTQIEDLKNEVNVWVDVFAEEANLGDIVKLREVRTTEGNIAGIDIPLFSEVIFEDKEYDLLYTPLWVDKAVAVCKQHIELLAKLGIYHRQVEILQEELRVVTQRVNLFEKIKIPQTRENIRVIQIYLGDLQTAEVVRGKLAKAKIEKRQRAFWG